MDAILIIGMTFIILLLILILLISTIKLIEE